MPILQKITSSLTYHDDGSVESMFYPRLGVKYTYVRGTRTQAEAEADIQVHAQQESTTFTRGNYTLAQIESRWNDAGYTLYDSKVGMNYTGSGV